MDWNLKNSRERDQKENPSFELNLNKYELKKPKKVNPNFELKKQISQIVGKPILQILGLTKGWDERDLKGCISDSLAFKENPQARMWNIIKEINLNKNDKRKNI